MPPEKTMRMIRAIAVKNNDVNDLFSAMIESIEPDLHAIDASTFYASAAISLKRIADAAEEIAAELKHARLNK